ncbi:MAG: universal stress protein [candidate division Zixibacteria bacterium]|nr:universal stress protein [Gammaproteobacteria bacterium]NIX55918.1 universal stress protein [candidate division Zixibacteria bacterium]
MSGIVCAIRGGPASKPTIIRAITLAQETGQKILFLYIVNLDFLERTASSRTHTITKELQNMGEFILLTAQVQAQQQGVEADGVIREGNVSDEIIQLCQETQADYVILGNPKGEPETNAFTRERLNTFAQHIEEASGAKAILVEEDQT